MTVTTAKADCKNEKIARHLQTILNDHVLVDSTTRNTNVVEFATTTPTDRQRIMHLSQLSGLPIMWTT